MRNAVIIPCYNESERLQFASFKSFLIVNPHYTLCFVNDGSTDDTLEKLEDFCSSHHNAMVYDMPKNGGKAEAVRQGVNFILNNYSFDQIGFMDADLSTSLAEYKKLAETLEDQESLKIVFGSRQSSEENNIERTFFRDIASKAVSAMTKVILGLPIHDTQCGAKVFEKQTARYCFSKSFLTRWLFDVEIFIKMKNLYGEKTMRSLQELPLTEWVHVDGSKISVKDSLRIPRMLLNIYYNYKVVPTFNQLYYKLNLAGSLGKRPAKS